MILHNHTVGQGRPMAFVHGFTQTSTSWNALLSRMRTPVSAQLIDAPGHGGSTIGTRSLDECGFDIRQTMRPGILVGYSMGARMCLHAALGNDDSHDRRPPDPRPIEGLVLISGTAGIDDIDERKKRRLSDETLARRIETDGVEAFLEHWLAQPMFENLPDDPVERASRLTNTVTGLADSLRHAGTGTQEPLWERLARIDVPVLIIAGVLDTKFTALAHRMHDSMPGSRLELLPAGHSVHLENPTSCAAAIDAWLGNLDDPVSR